MKILIGLEFFVCHLRPKLYRVSHLNMLPLWSYIQGWVFHTFSWLISQIKAKGCANRLVESHFWWSNFWRENSNICYVSALETIKIQMRHFLIILKHYEVVHAFFENSFLYLASKLYHLAWATIYNLIVFQYS